MNLTMNSGDLPDAFLVTYSGAVPDETKFGIEEGSLIDLTDLIETKMPNVKKLLEDKDGLQGENHSSGWKNLQSSVF